MIVFLEMCLSKVKDLTICTDYLLKKPKATKPGSETHNDQRHTKRLLRDGKCMAKTCKMGVTKYRIERCSLDQHEATKKKTKDY